METSQNSTQNQSENTKCTFRWFDNSELQKNLFRFLNPLKQNKILEIGTFEGLSATFFSNHFLFHPRSKLVTLDPYNSISSNDHEKFVSKETERMFNYNIAHSRFPRKVQMYKMTSDAFFNKLERKWFKPRFNFIYIDGCHDPSVITRDLKNSWKYLIYGGIVWLDDYLSCPQGKVAAAIDEFIKNQPGCEVVHKGYQIAIKKLCFNEEIKCI